MPNALTERPLTVSPSLAATIGLEAALLYQVLADYRQFALPEADGWIVLPHALLADLLPFWDETTIDCIITEIAGLDILSFDNSNQDRSTLRYNLTPQLGTHAAPKPIQQTARTPPPVAAAKTYPPAGPGGPSKISADWRPGQETMDYLSQFHNIGPEFVDAILPEFVHYWLERGEVRNSWSGTFNGWAVKRWKRHHQERREQALTTVMHRDWLPDIDAVELLRRDEIPASFIEDAIPEFVLYWRDDGSEQRNWNMRFVEHIRRQWARYTNALGGETELKRIKEDWTPSAAVFEILAMANIDADFARDLIPEFVLYWRDSGQLHRSWNSKFLQHAKFKWANSHQWDANHARQQNAHGQTDSALDAGGRQFVERLTDTSWADDVPLEYPG